MARRKPRKKRPQHLHPRDEAIRKARAKGRKPRPRQDCTGCRYRKVCKYPCQEIEQKLPSPEPPAIRFTDRWKWRRTQYVLDHEDDIKNPKWQFVVKNYFRFGWGIEKVAECLDVNETTVMRLIDRIVAFCWRLDRWRNHVFCEGQRREEMERNR